MNVARLHLVCQILFTDEYVPSVATIKQAAKLAEYGVKDPDAEWGDYVLLRP